MTQPFAHIVVAGDTRTAIKFGLTVMTKCGMVFLPKTDNVAGIPECADCHSEVPGRFADVSHFVYRCYDSEGHLIYVGCSVAPVQRMDQHKANSWWWEQVRHVRYVVFPNKDYALYQERRAIESENPRWNIRHRDRALWDVADYIDFYTALTKNGAVERRLTKVADEAQRRYGVDILEMFEQVPA